MILSIHISHTHHNKASRYVSHQLGVSGIVTHIVEKRLFKITTLHGK